MVVFILVLILLAILFSTEGGRKFLKELFLLPFRIIGFPFKLAREEKERSVGKEKERAESEGRGKTKKLFSEKQFGMLDKEKFNSSWNFFGQDMLQQVRLFESILEGGQDPRVMNLDENFSYIREDLLEKAKKELAESDTNYTSEVIQYIRKYAYTNNLSLNYEEIRGKLGKMPILGSMSKERIEVVLKDCTDFDAQKAEEVADFVLKSIKEE